FNDGEVRLWRVSDRSLVRTISTGDTTTFGIAFAPDGTLATGGRDWLVKLWIPPTSALVRNPTDHTHSAGAPGVVDGGKIVVSCGSDNQLVFWNANDGTIRRRDKTGDIFDIAVSPDGIIAVDDGRVDLYESEGGGPLPLVAPDAAQSLSRAVAFSA